MQSVCLPHCVVILRLVEQFLYALVREILQFGPLHVVLPLPRRRAEGFIWPTILQPKHTRFPRSRVSTEHSRPDRSAEGRGWEYDSTAMLRMKALRKSCMRSWDSTHTPAFLQASSTESMEPRTWSTTPRTTFSTDFRGFRCPFSRLSAIRNMRSAQPAAFERAFATRSCSWQAFKQSMNVGRRRTDQLVRIFLDRRLNQLLDTIHHSSHGAHHFVNARLFLMCLRLRPPGPDRRLRVLSHVLETCVELHRITSQSHASPSSCEGQRLLLCPQHTLRVEGPARRHVPGRGSLQLRSS